MGKSAFSSPPGNYAQDALREAALRAEFGLSIVRAAFCALVTLRFLSLQHFDGRDDFLRGALVLLAALLGAAFSLTVLALLRKGRVSGRLLGMSVVADAAICTAALLSNVLWPFAEYRGVLLLPETATFLAMIFAAGFRASPGLAMVGAAANGFGLAALVLVDRWLNGPLHGDSVNIASMYGVLFSCCAALAIVGARRTGHLVEQAALYSYGKSQAEQGLSNVLENHHDAMTLLSAALFGVERLKSGGAKDGDVARLAHELEQLHGLVSRTKEEALREVLVLRPPAPVSLKDVLERPRATFQRIAEPVTLEWRLDAAADSVLVAGGPLALQRMLSNLLVNAKEGDGKRGARHVSVVALPSGGAVAIEVEDDGPGFEPKGEATSFKPAGSATGLRFVRAVAEASGGSVRTDNTKRGGRVTVLLPRASS